MIPLYDQNPTRRLPWVTIALIALNVAVFAYELGLPAEGLRSLLASRAFSASRFFADPTDPVRHSTLITAMFLHGGWLHLLGNMLYLWIFGNNIEDRLGPWRFVLFYLCGGAVATLTQAAVDPSSTIPLVGASGAISAVLGAYALLFPRARVVTLIPIFFYVELAAVPAVFVIGFWFLMQLAQGLGSISEAALSGGVAWWAHIGGFAFGLLAITPVALADRARASRRRTRRPHD